MTTPESELEALKQKARSALFLVDTLKEVYPQIIPFINGRLEFEQLKEMVKQTENISY